LAKKASGKTYVSKGERQSSMKTPNLDAGQRMLNQIKALKKGKDVVWSMPNLNKEGKIVSYTRVKSNGKEYINNMKNMNKGQKEAAE
jgi:hypothetical protein